MKEGILLFLTLVDIHGPRQRRLHHRQHFPRSTPRLWGTIISKPRNTPRHIMIFKKRRRPPIRAQKDALRLLNRTHQRRKIPRARRHRIPIRSAMSHIHNIKQKHTTQLPFFRRNIFQRMFHLARIPTLSHRHGIISRNNLSHFLHEFMNSRSMIDRCTRVLKFLCRVPNGRIREILIFTIQRTSIDAKTIDA